MLSNHLENVGIDVIRGWITNVDLDYARALLQSPLIEVRTVTEGAIFDGEYRPNRINVVVNENNIITSVLFIG